MISIIIPMYNEQRYIARCLDSLKHQTYKDFEIILIDDGSKDNTVEIAKGYHKDFDLTILQQKNSGPGKARNRGAKIAKGDIFVFVDADMYFEKKYIEKLINPILEGSEEGTAHGTEKIGNPENTRARCRGLDRIPNPPKRSGVYRAISKKTFEKSGGYNNDRFAFEDNLGGKGGISALTVIDAICYHNNPENLKEIFNHDKRIGESMVAKGMIGTYIKKYLRYLILFILFLIAIIVVFIKNNLSIWWILIFGVGAIILFFESVAIKRSIQEKYRKYIWALPLVGIIRIGGYISGITKYLFLK